MKDDQFITNNNDSRPKIVTPSIICIPTQTGRKLKIEKLILYPFSFYYQKSKVNRLITVIHIYST